MDYRELNDTEYSKLRKSLIREKGSDFQLEFLQILKDSDQFINWFEARVSSEETGENFDLVSSQLSEHEFKEPTKQVEEELFQKWETIIMPAQACRSTFWGYVTLRHIKEEKIESFFLAANGGSLPGGLERIDEAIKSENTTKIDSVVRSALRRFSGLPEARGNRTVYVDCPFARAWWRCHIAKTVCEDISSADKDKIMEILRVNQAYWEELIRSVVSKNSVFGDGMIRAVLIWSLSERLKDKKSDLFIANNLTSIIKKIGVRLAWQELAVFSSDELKKIYEEEFLT
jgi:hypothetical protein